MLDLKHLCDETLLTETKRVVRQEREHLTNVLSHLAEVERRRLFSTLKFKSLHDYAMTELGYSYPSAHRRISAMRTIRGIPEVESAIEQGELDLTNINLAHAMFSREKKAGRAFSLGKKAEVFRAIRKLSTRETEKVLANAAPAAPKHPDQIKFIGDNRYLANFEMSFETYEDFEEFRGLMAHRNWSFNGILKSLLQTGLEQADPGRAKKRVPKTDSKAEIKRQIWRRDRNKCTSCDSQFFVQIDHEVPRAMGGDDSLENGRLLCRCCNQRAAIEKLGQEKMDGFLEGESRKMRE